MKPLLIDLELEIRLFQPRNDPWPPISGQVHTSARVGSSPHAENSSRGRVSKRWVVDRATLQQARADDLQYVDDPEYFTYFSIFFANGVSKISSPLGISNTPNSHHKARQEAEFPTTRDCDGYRLLSQVLHQERILRNRPVRRHRRLLLCRWESGRVARAHQERRRGSPFVF